MEEVRSSNLLCSTTVSGARPLDGGARFGKLLSAVESGAVYLDPAMKLILKPGAKPARKKRSQFRTKFGDLEAIYEWAIYYGGEPSGS